MLSCDYRMPFSKAKKLELPRLASTIIGCSYDELVRRQRSYRLRRIMVIVVALILINDYWVNEAGTRLAVVDYLGIITLWDTQTHSTVFTIDSPGLFTNDCVITDEAVVLSGVYAIRGFDPNTGELLWTFIDDEEAYGAWYLKLLLMDDGKLMSIRSDGRISIIDPATGFVG